MRVWMLTLTALDCFPLVFRKQHRLLKVQATNGMNQWIPTLNARLFSSMLLFLFVK